VKVNNKYLQPTFHQCFQNPNCDYTYRKHKNTIFHYLLYVDLDLQSKVPNVKVHVFKYFATIMCNVIIQKKCNLVHLGQNKYGRRWCQYDTRFQQHAYSCARQIILFLNIHLRMKYIRSPYKVMLKTYHHVDLWNHHMNGMHVYPHTLRNDLPTFSYHND